MTSAVKTTMTPEQARSTDPTLSAWVGASAGTGKTHVLTARVLRLMLTGTPPENIVCLTFTKAAAAEMKNRIFAELGRWTLMEDTALKGEIAVRTHEHADADMLVRARQLFAEVLDLAGGLQIQTFHSFCQSLLGRFPLEAGMAPGFEGIDESDAFELMTSARDKMLAASQEPLAVDLDRALGVVAGLVTERTFDDVIDRLVFDAPALASAIRVYGGVDSLMKAVYDRVGANQQEKDADIIKAACEDAAIDSAGLSHLAEALASGSSRDQDRGKSITAFLTLEGTQRPKHYASYLAAFLTKAGTPLKAVATQKVLKAAPHLEDIIDQEQQRLLGIEDRRRRLHAANATAALLRLGIEQIRLYRYVKDERGLVDFDDMIDRTVTLFSKDDVAPWILFKLDNEIDHILVDEAQDTNREQWRVVETLAAEFFAGEGARDLERTIFAVGDAKQSIFSFQRADPTEFIRARDRVFARASAAAMRAENVPLATSFRSGEAILSLVDQVFSHEGRASQGVSLDGEVIQHQFHRSGHAGLVELWPLETPARLEADDNGGWSLPVRQETTDDAERRTAWAIADHISASIGSRDLEAKGRTVAAGDILVLVRRRTAFVDHLMRALKSKQVPVTGRDRMTLLDELPVMDLLVLAQFAVLPDDNLALATVLKSPLVGLNDNALFDLAHGRTSTLWQRLKAASADPRFSSAYAFLRQILGAVDQGGPFDFFSFVLVDLDGRQKLAARLGNEIHDPIDELLEEAMRFQFTEAASLLKFIETVKRNNTQLKRDMEQAGNRVRIMTVHSAKGLQAPVVYLSDVSSLPDSTRDGRLLPIASDDDREPAIPFWASHARGLPEVEDARQALKDKQLAEYRRLLYVALTRAEDELYVAGWRGTSEPSEDCWYRLIEDGFDRLGGTEVADKQGRLVRSFYVGQSVSVKPSERPEKMQVQVVEMPDWARRPIGEEPTPTRPLTPSRPDVEPAVVGPTLRGQEQRFRRGNIMHQLLQWLPELPVSDREAAAVRYLSRFQDTVSETDQTDFLTEVMRILDHPTMAPLFAPGSRAEVPIAGIVTSLDGEQVRTVSGQVDRLVVTENKVLIIDYKTNRPPPLDARDVPVVYRRQMGLYARVLGSIYPGHKITASLLWTDGPRLMELSPRMLEEALLEIGL